MLVVWFPLMKMIFSAVVAARLARYLVKVRPHRLQLRYVAHVVVWAESNRRAAAARLGNSLCPAVDHQLRRMRIAACRVFFFASPCALLVPGGAWP
jgi:hypothetical protein